MSIDQNTNEGKKPRAPKISKYLWISSLLVCLSFPLSYIIDYVGGYRGFPLSIFFFPAAMFPITLAFILTFYVIIRSIWSAIRLRKLTLSLLLIPLTISFWFTWVIPLRLIPLNNSPFLLGFKHRILRTTSVNELYEIAAKSKALLPNETYLPGPGKLSFWEEGKHRPLWEQMSKYKILSIAQSSVVIDVNYDYVSLVWGGALPGHWGIRIASKPLKSDMGDPEYVLIDPNIAIFQGD